MTAVVGRSPVAAPAAAPPALRARLTGRVLTPVTVTLAVMTVGCALVLVSGGQVPMVLQLVPFAVSVLVFGLPHGALDHLVPARLRSGTGVARSVTVVVVLYLVVGAATALLWTVSPLAGFAVFVGITWFHWGQGDLFVDRLLGDGADRPRGACLTVAVRGALPMVLPFVAQPGAATAVVSGTIASIAGGGGGGGGAGPVGVPVPVRIVAGVVVLALVVLHLVAVRRGGGPVRRQASEDLVLVAFFVLVPPVLAVGLYFTLWHAVRHILRLELTDPDAAAELERGRLLAPFLRFARQAWPITAIAVAMLVALAVLVRHADLGVYLALIAALTTPHTVVVTWMDRVQRTWRPAADAAISPTTRDETRRP